MDELVLEELNDEFLNVLGEQESTRPKIYYGEGSTKGESGGTRACSPDTSCPSNNLCKTHCSSDCTQETPYCPDESCADDTCSTYGCRDATCPANDPTCPDDAGGCGGHSYLCELHDGCRRVNWGTCLYNSNNQITTAVTISNRWWNIVKVRLIGLNTGVSNVPAYSVPLRHRLLSGSTTQINRAISLLIRQNNALVSLSGDKTINASGYTSTQWFPSAVTTLYIPVWFSSNTHMQSSGFIHSITKSIPYNSATLITQAWRQSPASTQFHVYENTALVRFQNSEGSPIQGVFVDKNNSTNANFYNAFPHYSGNNIMIDIRTGLNGKILICSSAFTGSVTVNFKRAGYNGGLPFAYFLSPNVYTNATLPANSTSADCAVPSTVQLQEINPRIMETFGSQNEKRNYTQSQLFDLGSGISVTEAYLTGGPPNYNTTQNKKKILTYHDINSVGVDNYWITNEYLYGRPLLNSFTYTATSITASTDTTWKNLTPFITLERNKHYQIVLPTLTPSNFTGDGVATVIKITWSGTNFTREMFVGWHKVSAATTFIKAFDISGLFPDVTNYSGYWDVKFSIRKIYTGTGTGTITSLGGTYSIYYTDLIPAQGTMTGDTQ